MDIDHLVKMANQIGRFFEAWPDRAAARREVADHLTRFWEPRLRNALIERLTTDGAARIGATPLVAEAVAMLPPVGQAR
ncbi:formate dehydrogenase subunit delta [Azoarcus sp. KH32C]|uniref:formate dehydrogenase subunit delta n=1 Tax=Azoarcus sp. KH32C TaxID=748247 RepID=UPI0002385DF1|nr:formate dehydrogenase subunit delta [Azoarcus sp. KH32C]BAL27164.1 formate dehydrogenase, delta subunit [Azoarcus sp. KH32C]